MDSQFDQSPDTADKQAGPFYAVYAGRQPGIYYTWGECELETYGHKGAKFKKFTNYQDALAFMRDGPAPRKAPTKRSKQTSAQTTAEAPQDPAIVTIYTDGSCFNNGSQSRKATGGIGVFFGDSDHRNVAEPLGIHPEDIHTNNYAELKAIHRALDICGADGDIMQAAVIRICTDSMYCIRCLVDWYPGWHDNGFRLRDGSPVKNADLIRRIRYQIEDLGGFERIKFCHIKGHANHPGNEAADRLARMGSQQVLEI